MERGTKIDKDIEKMHQEAISTDASVFDYDGSYDTFKLESEKSNAMKASKLLSSSSSMGAPVRNSKNNYFIFIFCFDY